MMAPITDPADLGAVLGVWAHPDDEAFLSAGIMAGATRAGNRVMVVTATRGEQGTADPARWPPDRLGRLRESELAASLAALGVREHQFLGYVDGACSAVSEAEGVERVAAIIDEVQPDTILTFGPDGMTGHSDHRTVSRWVAGAVVATGTHARALAATTTGDFLDRFAAEHERFGVYFAGEPPWHGEAELIVHYRPGEAILDRKLTALRAQASQTWGLIEAMGEERFMEWTAVEAFVELVVPV
jgi:LmbE family N-acetylglucosaminyl deacetylase